ncbi:hypothetical protein NCS55_00075000 [Fusarium keratoplasticum]|nr:hypothetical protein NCS55_00075000 [Fusarium keratoplasticum]
MAKLSLPTRRDRYRSQETSRTPGYDGDNFRSYRAGSFSSYSIGQPPAEIQEIYGLLKAITDSPQGRPQDKAMTALKEALNAEEEAERRKQRIAAASFSSRPEVNQALLKEDPVWLHDAAKLIKTERDTPGKEPRLHKKISLSFKKMG